MDRSLARSYRLQALPAALAIIFNVIAAPILPVVTQVSTLAAEGTVTLEDGINGCMGVRTTPGSENTQKELIGGTLEPGGTALFQFTFPAEVQGNPGQEEWEITDCVFLNDEPFQKYTVTALSNDVSPVVIEFLLTIPSDVPVGAEFCDYAKTTQTPSDAQASNRKAGPACFIVGGALRVEKVDGAGEPLAGATFTVGCEWPNVSDGTFLPDTILSAPTNGSINGGASSESINSTDDGSFSRTVITGDLGVITVNGPVDTVCTFTETAAPPGYVLPDPPDDTVTLTIDDAGQQLYQFVNVLPPDLTISKTPDSGTVNAGDPISFTITVSNSNAPGTGTAINVDIDDTLPAGFEWAENPDKAECTIGSNVLHCDIASLAPGASFSVTVTSPTQAADCGLVSNPDATADADNHGQVSDSGQQTVQCPNLTISKTPDSGTVDAGDPISFTITVSNAGPGTATNVNIDDDLPAGFEWAENPDKAECTINVSDHLHCDIPSLASGADFSVTMTSPTQAADCGAVLNTATADADNHALITNDGNQNVQCPGLNIAKIASDEEIDAGETAEFEIVVWNLGPGTAFDVTLHDELPGDNLVWSETADPSDSCDVVANVLDCDFGDLGVTTMEGSVARVTVAAETDREDCGVLDNTAFADASNSDEIQASASITVKCPLVEILKTNDQPDPVLPGTVVTYTLELTVSDGPADGVVVVDTLPAGLDDPTDISLPGLWDGTTRTITWDLGDDVADGTYFLTYKAAVSLEAEQGDELTNVAVVTSTNSQCPVGVPPADECDDDSRVEVRVPTLLIVKAADVELITKTLDVEGNVIDIDPEVVTWTLTYTLTNGPVTNAVITDPIPAGLTYVAASASDGGVYNAGTETLTWTFPLLSDSGFVTFQTTVNEDAPAGVILNVTTIESNETESDEGEDSIRIVENQELGGTSSPLPNTALNQPSSGGSLAALLFGIILMAALGGLAYVNVVAVQRRR